VKAFGNYCLHLGIFEMPLRASIVARFLRANSTQDTPFLRPTRPDAILRFGRNQRDTDKQWLYHFDGPIGRLIWALNGQIDSP
jgi:hypothetical protein